MSSQDKEHIQDNADIRAEYFAIAEYSKALVTSRFTTVGFYIAAVGFLTGAILGEGATWPIRAIGSAVAIWVTLCLWIMELRTRALLENLSQRAITIEQRYWKLAEDEWSEGFFSRQVKVPPVTTDETLEQLPRRLRPDRPSVGWARRLLSERVSKYISHSMGTDLLFAGTGIFWSTTFITAIVALLIGE